MSTKLNQVALLRTLTWYETIGYAPTRAELNLVRERVDGTCQEEDTDCLEDLFCDGTLVERMGRIGFPTSLNRIVMTMRERDASQPRKRRLARRVAWWLARFGSVRFVALANTTALGCARDEGDVDLFVVVRAGTIWTTRLLGVLPFRLFGLTPRARERRDAVCLSYFIADDALDLSSHQLSGDDPYFRHWFLSLLPLYDDGVSVDLWNANAAVRERHPFARQWIVPPDLRIGKQMRRNDGRVMREAFRLLEPLARFLQMQWFPRDIRNRMNRDTTVIVNDHALKFHVTDGRAAFRETYYAACRNRGIQP